MIISNTHDAHNYMYMHITTGYTVTDKAIFDSLAINY